MNSEKIPIDHSNPEFRMAFQLLLETNANIFLTGRAGTGKSTFLRHVCKKLKKNYVVLAPTGVAAVNVGGVTIHSFFQMPLRPVPPDDPDYSVASFKKSGKFNRRKRKLIKELDLIIIDEVSMVRPDMIDFIDRALRGITGKRGKPFGGVQLLLIGDIFQLEPVVNPDTRLILSKYYSDYFFFNAIAYREVSLVSIELKKIYRQTDPAFISLLDRVRLNSVSYDDISLLNQRVVNDSSKEEENDFGVTLTARRDTAAAINKEKMELLPGEEFIFKGEIEDEFPEKILPTDLNLILKNDAQVMMIRNDQDRRWVNGTLGRIKELSSTSIIIALEDGKEVTVERETWENITYSYDEKEKKVVEEIIGRFTQFPLKAAWALTIHKSQGLTFNNVAIDLSGGAFSAGQTYVALSRCRSLEGLSFSNPLSRRDVIVSQGAKEYSKNFNDLKTTERAFNDAKATSLSAEVEKNFLDGKYYDAITQLLEIHRLVGALEKKEIVRLVSRKLQLITKLKNKVYEQRQKLNEVANMFLDEAVSFLKKKKISEASGRFKSVLDIDSENPNALLGLAECAVAENDYKTALTYLNKINKCGKDLKYKALMLKGEIYEKTNDFSRAALSYTSALKENKNEKEPLVRIIALYEKAGMEEQADEYKAWLDSK